MPGIRSGLKVLIVDDYRDAAESLALLLEAWGHQVRVATDPAAAERAAVAFAPDVVTLEVRLRRADGCDLARRLIERLGRRPAVVAVTGYAPVGIEERWRAAGIGRVLSKGCPAADLLAAIKEAGRPAVIDNPADN